jgi:biotin synthase-like enzyme
MIDKRNLFLVSHIPLQGVLTSATIFQIGYGVFYILNYLKQCDVEYLTINPLKIDRYVKNFVHEVRKLPTWDFFREEVWLRFDGAEYVSAILDEIVELDPDRIFFPVYYNFTYLEYIENLRLIRGRVRKNVEIVIGGHLATNNPNLFVLDEFQPIRSIPNEGEIPVFECITGRKAYKLPVFEFPLQVMADSGFYDVSRLHDDLIRIARQHEARLYSNIPLATGFIASRGCYCACSFCCERSRRMVVIPREKMLENLQIVRSRSPVRQIGFMDALFPITPRLTDELGKLDIRYSFQSRADFLLGKVKIDPDFIQKLHRSGCYRVGIGVESLNQAELDTLNKEEKVEEIIRVIQLLTDGGIEVFATCISGIPGQTVTSLKRTLDIFIRDLNSPLVEVVFFPLLVTRGSTLFNNFKNKKKEPLAKLTLQG